MKRMNWMVERDTLGEWRRVQEDVNRIFNGAFPRWGEQEEGLRKGSWTPQVDILEGANAIVLEVDLPGVKAEDFRLSIENFVLTIQGERRVEKEAKGEQYHRVERHYGTFARSFTLPTTVQVEQVAAEIRDGVLRITLPKREEVKARQIEVTVRGAQAHSAGAGK
jgi:HSP20 family protein